MWFNSDSRKMTKKQSIFYNKQKKTCDSYGHKQYLECRRNTKKAIRKIKKDYVENRIYKPLKKGKSQPFYQHLKGHKNGKKMFRLTRPDATMATDATECANMLNNYFHQQFYQYHLLSSIPKKIMTDHGHHTDPDGVAKLLRGLQKMEKPQGLIILGKLTSR